MFRFVAALFGCPHSRCTFPITAGNPSRSSCNDNRPSVKTNIVCLKCGKEFLYDWQRMKMSEPPNKAEGQ